MNLTGTKKIAIVGATGMLGQPVTTELINAGFEVSILARDTGKARQIFGPAPRVIQGDLKNTESLAKLLEGQDIVYMSLSVEQNSNCKDFQPEREGLANILQAIQNSTVKRIGWLASLVQLYQGHDGFNWWAFDIKEKAIASIKASGISYSIFYPSTFMENFDKGSYRQGKMIVLAGNSRHKMFFISGSDYGKQVVRAFQLDNDNHEYIVQGKEGYTAGEASKIYVENYQREKLRILKVPIGVLNFFGRFSNKASYGAKVLDALNNYPEKFEAEKTWQELGIPQTRFVDYIRKIR